MPQKPLKAGERKMKMSRILCVALVVLCVSGCYRWECPAGSATSKAMYAREVPAPIAQGYLCADPIPTAASATIAVPVVTTTPVTRSRVVPELRTITEEVTRYTTVMERRDQNVCVCNPCTGQWEWKVIPFECPVQVASKDLQSRQVYVNRIENYIENVATRAISSMTINGWQFAPATGVLFVTPDEMNRVIAAVGAPVEGQTNASWSILTAGQWQERTTSGAVERDVCGNDIRQVTTVERFRPSVVTPRGFAVRTVEIGGLKLADVGVLQQNGIMR
jgi:hypothetical protein